MEKDDFEAPSVLVSCHDALSLVYLFGNSLLGAKRGGPFLFTGKKDDDMSPRPLLLCLGCVVKKLCTVGDRLVWM